MLTILYLTGIKDGHILVLRLLHVIGPGLYFIELGLVRRSTAPGRRAIGDFHPFRPNPFFRRRGLLGRSVPRISLGQIPERAPRRRITHSGRPGGGVADPGRLPSYG